MDALREYFNQRYDAQFGFYFKPESLDLKGLVYLEVHNKMKEGMEKTFIELKENIKDKNLEPLVANEVLFFHLRALMKVVESRLIDLQLIQSEQKHLSELILDVCFSGEGGSLLAVCKNEQWLLAESAKRREASEMTKAVS